jgi:hypothetical protein
MSRRRSKRCCATTRPCRWTGAHVFEDIELGGITIPAGSSNDDVAWRRATAIPSLVEDPGAVRRDPHRHPGAVVRLGHPLLPRRIALARLEGRGAARQTCSTDTNTWEIVEEPAWRTSHDAARGRAHARASVVAAPGGLSRRSGSRSRRSRSRGRAGRLRGQVEVHVRPRRSHSARLDDRPRRSATRDEYCRRR